MKLLTIESHLAFIREGTAVIYSKGCEKPKSLRTTVADKVIKKSVDSDYYSESAGYIAKLIIINKRDEYDKLGVYVESIKNTISNTNIKKYALSLSANDLKYDESLKIHKRLVEEGAPADTKLFIYQ